MWGVGPKAAITLHAAGFAKIGDLAATPLSRLEELLGESDLVGVGKLADRLGNVTDTLGNVTDTLGNVTDTLGSLDGSTDGRSSPPSPHDTRTMAATANATAAADARYELFISIPP